MYTFNSSSENSIKEETLNREEIPIEAVYYSRSDLEPASLIWIRPGFMNETFTRYDSIHDRMFEIVRRNFHAENTPPKIELTTKRDTHIRLRLLDLKTYNDFIKMNNVSKQNFNTT
jgi:hypothetical protein